jgi:hypothetical protein
MLHPVDHLAVFLFLNGDVGHGGGGRGSMPVFLAGREPNDIAGPDLLDPGRPLAAPSRSRPLQLKFARADACATQFERLAQKLHWRHSRAPDQVPETADRLAPCQ